MDGSPESQEPPAKRRRHDRDNTLSEVPVFGWRGRAAEARRSLHTTEECEAEGPGENFSGARVLDGSRCLARSWNAGQGGQCSNKPQPDQPFCRKHVATWKTHGCVDGEIPANKMQEFRKAATKSNAVEDGD